MDSRVERERERELMQKVEKSLKRLYFLKLQVQAKESSLLSQIFTINSILGINNISTQAGVCWPSVVFDTQTSASMNLVGWWGSVLCGFGHLI